MKGGWISVVWILFSQAAPSLCQGAREDITTFYSALEKKTDYDPRIRPQLGQGNPVEVGVKIYINHISEISEKEMTITMSLFLRQTWTDRRLVLGQQDQITDSGSLIKKIWLPDPYFVNGEDARPALDVGHRYFIVHHNGTVFFSERRLGVPFACPMNLANFPMDTQVCTLALESYGHTTKDMTFYAIDGGVGRNDQIELAQFKLTRYGASVTTRVLDTGNFSRFEIELSFTRQYGHYIFTVYIASIMIVCLSWLSFWLDIHAVPARISLGVLCVLTQTTQTMSVLSTIPRVSYIKAVDIWMASCLFFAFAALIEFAVANSAARLSEQRIRQKEAKREAERQQDNGHPADAGSKDGHSEMGVPMEPGTPSSDTSSLTRRKGVKNYAKTVNDRLKRHFPRTHILDRISRIAFPIMFVIMNIVYWIVFGGAATRAAAGNK